MISCKIKNVKKIETIKTVYDIETTNHNFIANDIVVHNSISDFTVSNRILPMVGSSDKIKIIKIGVPKYRNHFYKSFKNPMYKKLVFDWIQSPILLQSGVVVIKDANGNELKLSKYCLDRMPLQLKMKFFPNNPELHYDGDMSELDFITQYMCEWVEQLNLLINEAEQNMLVDSPHEWLSAQILGEEYYFGADFGSGTLLPKKSNLDFTALSIIRKTNDNIKEVVRKFEWQGDPIEILEEIAEIIHPTTGLFPCKFGLLDFSVIGVTGLSYFQKLKIPCEGIMFGSTNSNTKKNWKNSLVEQVLFELKAGRFKYPSKIIVDSIPILKKAYNEWCNIEKEERLGINALIEAADNGHDDHFFADSLGCYAADKHNIFDKKQYVTYRIPSIVVGMGRTFGGTGQSSGSGFGELLKKGR